MRKIITFLLRYFIGSNILDKDVCQDSLRVKISEFGVKLEIDSLLGNRIVTKQMRAIIEANKGKWN